MNKAYVYRYIDKQDSIVKYYGIVYGKTRSLEQRLNEHKYNDDWCKNGSWIIEYIEVNNRTEAELYEAHYIAVDKTYNYFNKAKANWGKCSFIPNRNNDWKDVSYYKKTVELTDPAILAETYLRELFALNSENERYRFARRITSRKSDRVCKTKQEKDHWEQVIKCINEQLAKRIFGEYVHESINVFLDGNGDIKIRFGTLNIDFIYNISNKTYKECKTGKYIYSKTDVLKYIKDLIDEVCTIKPWLISNIQ